MRSNIKLIPIYNCSSSKLIGLDFVGDLLYLYIYKCAQLQNHKLCGLQEYIILGGSAWELTYLFFMYLQLYQL